MYDQNNIFAKILRNEISAKKVYENDFALAFHDVEGKAPIHVLVIPKGEYLSFSDFIGQASEIEILQFYKAVETTIQELHLKEAGFRLISNSGINGGQEVPHFHIHILGGTKIGPLVSGTLMEKN